MPWSADRPAGIASSPGGVAFWEAGVGPPVVLVHGFPDHPIGLEPLARGIASRGFRCIAPALPGFYPSPAPPAGDFSPGRIMQTLLEFMDDLGLDRVAYVGHDWGAELGFPLVAGHPDRFVTFVSLATPHPAGYAERRREFTEMQTAWYAIFLAYAPNAAAIARSERWLTALCQAWSPGLHRARWPEIVGALQQPGVMEAVCEYYRANLDEPPRDLVIEVPAMIIHGGTDGCIRSTAYPDFSAHFRAGYVPVFLPAAGHWPHLESPDVTLQAISSALRADGWPPG